MTSLLVAALTGVTGWPSSICGPTITR